VAARRDERNAAANVFKGGWLLDDQGLLTLLFALGRCAASAQVSRYELADDGA